VWSWRPEDKDAYATFFQKYQDSHPGITVAFQTFKNTEYPQVLTTGLTGSNGPDIAQVQAYGKLQPYVDGGNLLPLDGEIAGLDKIDKAALAGATGRKDGKTYGVPFAVQTIQMFYNKALFAKHNLTAPTTWDEFIAVNDALLAAKITPIAVGGKDAWTLPVVHEALGSAVYGGIPFRDEVVAGKTDFTDPRFVASVQVLTDLQKYLPANVVGVSYTEAQSLFLAGQAAMFPGGSFEFGFFTSQNADLELGVFQVPPAPGAASSTALTPGYADGSWAINQATAHRAEALELLTWMASPEYGQLFADALGQMSPIEGVAPSQPLVAEMAKNYAEHPSRYLLLTDFRWGSPLGTDVMGNKLQELFLGKINATGVAEGVQKGIATWFTPSK